MGLMGEIARTVAAGLGDEGVFGVLPEALAPREVRQGPCTTVGVQPTSARSLQYTWVACVVAHLGTRTGLAWQLWWCA